MADYRICAAIVNGQRERVYYDGSHWLRGPYLSAVCPAPTLIVKEYPVSGDLFTDWTESEVAFWQDEPPVSRLCESAGWLSPDGAFYPCGQTEHDKLAYQLGAVFYADATVARIETEGWLRVAADGAVQGSYATQAQLDTLFDLAGLASSHRYQENLYATLERLRT